MEENYKTSNLNAEVTGLFKNPMQNKAFKLM
jgi:hypothetical protein